MTGTKLGSQKVAQKLKAKDPDYYKKLGHLGGIVFNPSRGFANMTYEKRAEAGRIGGLRSKRTSKKAGK